MQRFGDLEIRHDLRYHRRLFVFQRIGWMLFALFVLAALLGLVGAEGPLNAGTAGNDKVRVEYERFPHQESPTQIEITLQDSRQTSERVELWVDAAYLNQVRLQHVSPEPNEVIASGGRLGYVFKTAQPGEALTVALLFTPNSAGRLRGEVRAGSDGAPVRFSQFVYP